MKKEVISTAEMQQIVAYKHLPTGRVFTSKGDLEEWMTKEKNRIKASREREKKRALIHSKLSAARIEIKKEVAKKNTHRREKEAYIVNHEKVRETRSHIDAQRLQVKKGQLAIQLLGASLKNQIVSAGREFVKKYPLDEKRLRSLRSKISRYYKELSK